LGATLRAIGRGLGSGTFGLAHASVANNPAAKARLVARAIGRNAAAREGRVTAFLRVESFKSLRPELYLIEYADKILKFGGTPEIFCTSTTAK
jgi:hypothetical protein